MSGLDIRKAVMGEAFVEAAMTGDPFLEPLQSLGKLHELKGHLRGARRNGASWEELREVLHAAVYAGVPASAEALRVLSGLRAEELGAA